MTKTIHPLLSHYSSTNRGGRGGGALIRGGSAHSNTYGYIKMSFAQLENHFQLDFASKSLLLCEFEV